MSMVETSNDKKNNRCRSLMLIDKLKEETSLLVSLNDLLLVSSHL